jgi:hypothetical protein|tara:strand:+ start:392 stop:1693 length:1302 start_codon:yes stop_codon:yes gene_type:complete
MAKISNTTNYPTKGSPAGTDYVIGTDASSKETKSFTLQSIADLYAGSGSGTVTSVSLSGGTTGLTVTGSPVTSSGTITLAGTLATTNGGTGLTSIGTAGQVLKVNSLESGLEWGTAGGSTSPDSPVNSVQFNEAGAFGGSNNLTYTDSNRILVIGDQDTSGGVVNIAGGPTGGAGQLRLGDDGTSGNEITLKAAADVTGAYNIVLPGAAPGGNNKILESDSSGNLSWITTPGSSGTISVQDSGGAAISGINTLNFNTNLSVVHASGSTTATINGPSIANGISPFPIYQAKDSVAVGGQTIIRQSVCETAGTYSRLEYFSVGASSNPVYFAIYTGAITAAGSATKRLEGFNSTSSAGINVINFSSSYNFTAGQDIVIVVSANDTLNLAGSATLLSHADICRGAAVYTSSFPSTLEILLDGITDPVATGVCTHIY